MAFILSSIWFCFSCSKWILTLPEREQISDCTKPGKQGRGEKNLEAREKPSMEDPDGIWQDENGTAVMGSSGAWREPAQQVEWKAGNLGEKGSPPWHCSLSHLGLDSTTLWSVRFRPSMCFSMWVAQSLGGKVCCHNWHHQGFCWGCHWDCALCESLEKRLEQRWLYFSMMTTLVAPTE